ncbi:MAG: ATPase, T2SS/T4P/T4SS family, partial [Candidatus Peregrinibacteria bacterium]|nr:ATPase, T2SS/T4P/T4SS family [Candidatus Peregrinibacteria bacterium]
SIFSQRELGKDTLTFSNALHSASREDPNIVMVSEINDADTLDAVLKLVEMGHLVIASMTTKNVLQTIEHVISMYAHEDQEIMLDRFADSLACIMSQDLLDRVDQPGRAAIFEILTANKGVRNIIRHATLSQLRTAMESGSGEGMITMDNYALQLAQNGFISQDDANQYIPEAS